MSLVELQMPIDAMVANALIGATPEHWRAAELAVTDRRDDIAGQEQMSLVISSPEGHREPVTPTDEIYEALYKLSDLYRTHAEKMWRSVTFVVREDADGWRYEANFEY